MKVLLIIGGLGAVVTSTHHYIASGECGLIPWFVSAALVLPTLVLTFMVITDKRIR